MDIDVIVNAANSSLMGGGGVDGAIHCKGGPRILEECKRIKATEWPDGLLTGKAVITSGETLRPDMSFIRLDPFGMAECMMKLSFWRKLIATR